MWGSITQQVFFGSKGQFLGILKNKEQMAEVTG
jgi:hypothetical protein